MPDDRMEAPEERRGRRWRWVSIGEIVAVAAVIVSALTLWISYGERQDAVSQRQEGAVKAAQLTLAASVEDGGKWLSIRAVSENQTIQNQQVEFPAALKVDVADTAGEPRIEAQWFAEALKKVRAAGGKPDDSRGDERLPVAITTRFLADGHLHEDRTIYDIGYSIKGRMLSGHTLTLRGLSLVQRVTPGELQPLLDSRWARIMPAPK